MCNWYCHRCEKRREPMPKPYLKFEIKYSSSDISLCPAKPRLMVVWYGWMSRGTRNMSIGLIAFCIRFQHPAVFIEAKMARFVYGIARWRYAISDISFSTLSVLIWFKRGTRNINQKSKMAEVNPVKRILCVNQEGANPWHGVYMKSSSNAICWLACCKKSVGTELGWWTCSICWFTWY